MKTKLLQEFKNSEIKIISEEKLIQYIQFCMDNNEDGINHQKHHILPKSLFLEYTKLNMHKWNLSNLSSKNHFTAHKILLEAIDNDKMRYSFNFMCNTIGGTPEDYDLARKSFSVASKNTWASKTKEEKFISRSLAWSNRTEEELLIWKKNISEGLKNRSEEDFKKSEIKRLLSRSKVMNTSWYFQILDENDNIRFNNISRFRLFCKDNNLPYSVLVKTIKTGKRLYEGLSDKNVKQIKEENLKYIGWKVLKIK